MNGTYSGRNKSNNQSKSKVEPLTMVLFEGRILITDCCNKDDRDAVITNILNHKGSRAKVYVMVKDFKDVSTIRTKFPTTLPFVLVPRRDINKTRKLLNLLPHMDHFVNFLGQEVALQFLNERNSFRIKDISMAYARTGVIDKILKSTGQGIIFNVDTNDKKSKDSVVAVGLAAKKSVKKVFSSMAGQSSSTEENQPLLSNENESNENEQGRGIDQGTGSENSPTAPNRFLRFLTSLFFFLCPCIDDTRVSLPVNRYPSDLDMKLVEEFDQLYESLGSKWIQKLEEAHHFKEDSLKKLKTEKEELIKQEISGLQKESSTESSKANYTLVRLNVNSSIKAKRNKINEEYERELDTLYVEHYEIIIDHEIERLILFWKKVRLTNAI